MLRCARQAAATLRSECVQHRGQVIVELAITLPFLLFLILSATEIGFMLIAKAHQDRATAVVAEWAARHPGESWSSVAADELHGCDVAVEETEPHRIVEARATCWYQPAVLRIFSGLPMSSRENAAGEPVASPSSSSTTRPAGRLA